MILYETILFYLWTTSSGSTLLSAILKQNLEFYADIASPVDELTGNAIDVITDAKNNLTTTEEQRKNLML